MKLKESSSFIKKASIIIVKKPHRVIPHVVTRLTYWGSFLFRGYAGFPLTIYLGVSNQCNLRCKMCDLGQGSDSVYRKYLSPSSELPLSEWEHFIDSVSKYNPLIELSTAEPLLYKDIIPLVRYIKIDKNLSCNISTNGYLLREFAPCLKELAIDRLIVSIDGPPALHDRIRGKTGVFDRVIDGLKQIKAPFSQEKPLIDINYTVSDFNYSHILETFKILRSKQVPFDRYTIIQPSFVTPEMASRHNRQYPEFPSTPVCQTGIDFYAINTELLREQIAVLSDLEPAVVRMHPDFPLEMLNIWHTEPDKSVGNKKCLFLWNSANITADGEVIPYMRCANISFGNICDKTFDDIWNGWNFRNFRLISRRAGMFPICLRCNASFMK